MEPSNLDNPEYAAFAWDRYRRLMIWMALVSVIAAVVSLWVLREMTGPLPIPMVIATGAGVFASVMLAAGLMGLVFLSNGTGHDDSVADPFKDQTP
jgi:preprotein translocase subunit SecF